jgi:hypothetical protein
MNTVMTFYVLLRRPRVGRFQSTLNIHGRKRRAFVVRLHYGGATHEAGLRLLSGPPFEGRSLRRPIFCLRKDDGNLLSSRLPGSSAAETFLRVR